MIQLTGGFSRAIFESGALDVLKRFVDSVGGTGYQIPAPAMVAESSIVEALKKDPQIHEILEMAEVCQTAIYSVGNLERPSIVYEMGLIDENDYKDFSRRGAVGDCCSHFIKQNGELFDKKISQTDLSKIIGYDENIIAKYENQRAEPCVDDLIKLARYFEVSVDYLIGNTSISEPVIPTRLKTDYETLSSKEKNAVKLIISSMTNK